MKLCHSDLIVKKNNSSLGSPNYWEQRRPLFQKSDEEETISLKYKRWPEQNLENINGLLVEQRIRETLSGMVSVAVYFKKIKFV